MKRYKVYMKFKNGKEIRLETNTDVLNAPVGHHKSGAVLLVTEEQHVINIIHIKIFRVLDTATGDLKEFNSMQISAWVHYNEQHAKDNPTMQKQFKMDFNKITEKGNK